MQLEHFQTPGEVPGSIVQPSIEANSKVWTGLMAVLSHRFNDGFPVPLLGPSKFYGRRNPYQTYVGDGIKGWAWEYHLIWSTGLNGNEPPSWSNVNNASSRQSLSLMTTLMTQPNADELIPHRDITHMLNVGTFESFIRMHNQRYLQHEFARDCKSNSLLINKHKLADLIEVVAKCRQRTITEAYCEPMIPLYFAKE
jgi:hypothetical protein